MKAVKILFVAAAFAAAGCTAKPSPETTVTCGATEGIFYTGNPGDPVAYIMVQKSVALSDPGLGGEVPANGIIATIISPVDTVQVCKGDCLDGSGTFKQELDVATDDIGILKYTAELDPSVPFTGDLLESFHALDACTTAVQVGP